jgi:hypothetical protein
MSTVTSFAELVSQHAEPLPARTVMSLFQVALRSSLSGFSCDPATITLA